MWEFILRFFGITCCGEWSKWETVDNGLVRWQERRCEKCGKLQQRFLFMNDAI
jgi:hypothetical protein